MVRRQRPHGQQLPGKRLRWVALSAGSVSPRFELRESLHAIERIGVAEAVRLFRRHKVRGILADRLAGVPDSPVAAACLNALAPDLAQLRHVHEELLRMTGLLGEAASHLSIPIGLFKGAAAARWYQDATWRDVGDLDVFIRSWADARALADFLRRRGYAIDAREFPWLKRESGGRLYGQILLSGSHGEIGVDIHFGRYSVRHCTHLPIDLPGTAGVHVVAHADNVSAVINNAAGDLFASMKDVNDLLQASGQWPEEFATGIARIKQVKLDGFLASLVRLANETSILTPAQRERFAGAAPRLVLEPAAPSGADSWNRRWIATTMHSFRVGRAASVLDGARLAIDAQRYYRKRLSLEVVESAVAPILSGTGLNEHQCVRLIPLDLVAPALDGDAHDHGGRGQVGPVEVGNDLDEQLRVITTPRGEVVAVGEELFIPTVYYRIPADLVRAAQKLSGSQARLDRHD